MSDAGRPARLSRSRLSRWLSRHSLTLVAALGGAVGVAYAAGWHTSAASAGSSPVRPWAFDTSGPMTPTSITRAIEGPRDTVQDTVQIALLLDTSSSMDGLINQARSHLWNVVDQMGKLTRVVDGKVRGVKVELALYEYGHSSLPAQDGHIRQVLPLTSDLDKVSEMLHSLYTNGGNEYAGQAIQLAAEQLQWSSDPNALKFVFVAGNESFDQGHVTAAAAMAAAAQRGITVQLIHCGTQDPTWTAAAKLATTDLTTIDQNHVAAHIPAPQDDELLRLGNELNGTYMAYGAEGQVAQARQAQADVSSAKLSKKVALERAQLKSKSSYDNSKWDLVDAIDKRGSAVLENAEENDLPAALRGKSLDEQQKIVSANATKRAEIKGKIAKLEADRKAFLAAEQAKAGGDEANSLETELLGEAKKSAAKKGYKF